MKERPVSLDGGEGVLIAFWIDCLTVFSLLSLMLEFLKHGRGPVRFLRASRGGHCLFRVFRGVGIFPRSSERVHNSGHGWRVDSKASLVIESTALLERFAEEFYRCHANELSRLNYPDARVDPDRVKMNIKGTTAVRIETLIELSEFVFYWQNVNVRRARRVHLLSSDAVFLSGISASWLRDGFSYIPVWDPRRSPLLRAGWALLCWGGDCLRKRGNTSSGPARVGVTFHSTVRSDERVSLVHWWPGSGIPPDRVVVIFERSDIPCSLERVKEIERQGFRVVVMKKNSLGSAPRTVLWRRPGVTWKETFRRLTRKLKIIRWAWGSAEWQQGVAGILLDLMYVSERAADLMSSYNLKALIHYKVGEMDWASVACDLQGGVRFREQRSAQHWPILSTACSEHVFFAWGKREAEVVRATGGSSGYIFVSGCIVKGAGVHLCQLNTLASGVRRSLEEKGAKKILVLFNSSTPGEPFFRFFFRRAQEDSQWGYVVKPKRTKDFYEEMEAFPDVLHSFNCLLSEGRVKVIPDNVSPAQIGCAGDFSVSWGINSAAVVDFISGHRALMLDLPRMDESSQARYATFHLLGKKKLVFNGFHEIWPALKRHYADVSSSDLGVAIPELLQEIDPFRDEGGGLRMGEVLAGYLSGIDEGLTWRASMDQVAQRYRSRWGEYQVFEPAVNGRSR